MGEKKFQRAIIEIANLPDVAHAFRKMLEVRGDPEKKDLFQRRQSTLNRTIAKKTSRPGELGEVCVEAVLDYLETPLVETEPEIMEFLKKDFDLISLPQRQDGRSKWLRETDLAPAVGAKRPLVYKIEHRPRSLRNSNCVIVAPTPENRFDDPKVDEFVFGVYVGTRGGSDYLRVIVVDGPAQALALADYYDREGMPNPVKRERLRRSIKRTKRAIEDEQSHLAEYEKELAALGDGR